MLWEGKNRCPARDFLIEHHVPSIHFVLYVHILVLQCVAFFLNDEEIGHPHIPPLRLATVANLFRGMEQHTPWHFCKCVS